jgi:hypothetical protein
LILVTQTGANRKIGPEFPIVLRKTAKIKLLNRGFRVARGNRELSRAAAQEANLRAGESLLQTLLRYLIGLNTG